MKYFIILLLVMFMTPMASADVYIVTDTDTKDVISVSNENDCVVKDGMTLTVDKTIDLEDIALVNHPRYYTYDKGKFKANMSKLQEKEAKELEKYEKDIEVDKIEKRMRKLAIDTFKIGWCSNSSTIMRRSNVLGLG